MPILVAIDNRTKMMYARLVPQKGQHDYATGALKKIAKQLGYKRIVTSTSTSTSAAMSPEESAAPGKTAPGRIRHAARDGPTIIQGV